MRIWSAIDTARRRTPRGGVDGHGDTLVGLQVGAKRGGGARRDGARAEGGVVRKAYGFITSYIDITFHKAIVLCCMHDACQFIDSECVIQYSPLSSGVLVPISSQSNPIASTSAACIHYYNQLNQNDNSPCHEYIYMYIHKCGSRKLSHSRASPPPTASRIRSRNATYTG